MFYVVESEEQLQKLEDLKFLKDCYVEVVTTNDNIHPALTSVVAVYINPFEEELDPDTQEVLGWKDGYIIPVDHNEGLCVGLDRVQEILLQFETVYVLDRKATLYFLNHPNFVDLSIAYSMQNYSKLEYFVREKTYNWFYNRYGGRKDLNKIIPLTKIFEKCRNTFIQIKPAFEIDWKELPGFQYYNKIGSNLFYLIEKEGIRVDVHEFVERFHPTNPDFSIEGETVYTRYNLCNTTGRPTNSFNSVNFLAIPKGTEFRRCFKPKNDEFIQMDFDGYHVRLVSSLIGYDIPLDQKAHMYLAKQYFGKDNISKEEYGKAKQTNFQSIYGAIPEEYKHLEFFRKLKSGIDEIWNFYRSEKHVADILSGKWFTEDLEDMRPTKLMNYLIQSYETTRNISVLYKALKRFQNCKSKIILVTYDSILIDWSKEDGEELLTEIKQILEQGKFPVSVEKSKDLNFS